MLTNLPKKLIELANICQFPLYVVGGTCRDFLLGIKSERYDFDICAPVGAEEFCQIAKNCGFTLSSVYKNTGTAKLLCEGFEYEFASFRSDEYVRGVHSPTKTFFTNDIKKDALRRDFKCNAIYFDIKENSFIDPLGGIEDIKNGVINTVREPEKVFGEDGLRLMRLARFSATTGLEPTRDCMIGAIKNRRLIDDISAERIFSELDAILHADTKYGRQYAQYNGLLVLKNTGVLQRILPELAIGDKMQQRKDYHNYDVLEHCFHAVKYADKSVRLAALLHDVAKPYCYINFGAYRLHDSEGAMLAEKILKRLKVGKSLSAEVCKLIALHMYDLNMTASEGKVRKFIVKNYDVLQKLYLLKQADYSAYKDDLSVAPCIAKWKNIEEKMKAEGAPFNLKQLKINGDDLLNLGVAPQKVGAILCELLYECVQNGALNNKARLLTRAEKLKEIL